MTKPTYTLFVFFSIVLVLFLFLGTANSVFAYGGGGGGGGGGGDGSGGAGLNNSSQDIHPLSDEEVQEIFDLIGGEKGDFFADAFSGSDYTRRELMEIRQRVLEGDMRAANNLATIVNGLTITVECLDQAGQVTQIGLSFVPGVGWVTAGLLDTARGAADAYRDGKDAGEILREGVIAGVSSVTINKLSPLGADKTFNNARSAWNIIRTGSGKHTGKAIKIFSKNAGKYIAKKQAERSAGDQLKDALRNAGKQTPNRVSRPTYSTSYMGPGSFTVNKYGQKVYK